MPTLMTTTLCLRGALPTRTSLLSSLFILECMFASVAFDLARESDARLSFADYNYCVLARNFLVCEPCECLDSNRAPTPPLPARSSMQRQRSARPCEIATRGAAIDDPADYHLFKSEWCVLYTETLDSMASARSASKGPTGLRTTDRVFLDNRYNGLGGAHHSPPSPLGVTERSGAARRSSALGLSLERG